jgi:hypothetical protein
MAKPQETPASEGRGDSDAARAVSAAVDAYEEALGKHGGSPCDRYILMAVHDPRVQQAIARHIADNEMFMGAHCPAGPGIPEQARVVFEFRCLPPRICLMPSLFMAVLNAYTGRVLQVIDPYVAGEQQAPASPESAAGGRTEPSASVPQSVLSMHHPGLAASHPSLAASHPGLAASHPLLAASHPSLAASHPGLAASHPGLAASHPGLAASHPGLAASHPGLAASHPGLAASHPTLAASHPGLAFSHPGL